MTPFLSSLPNTVFCENGGETVKTEIVTRLLSFRVHQLSNIRNIFYISHQISIKNHHPL